MSGRAALDGRIEEQKRQKRKPLPDTEPDEMDMEQERERLFQLNQQKSVFDSTTGNRTPGINTEPSIFERTAVFRKDKKQ